MEQGGARDDDGEALRARDCDVEAVFVVEELDVAGEVVGARGGHRDEDCFGLLALELVDGADAGAGGEDRLQQVHLRIVGRYDQDVVGGDRVLEAFLVAEALLEEVTMLYFTFTHFFFLFLSYHKSTNI